MKSFRNPMHQQDYDRIINQMDGTIKTFGEPIQILVLSDRLIGCAEGLGDYFSLFEDITIKTITNREEFDEAVKTGYPDCFIVVGYLEERKSYGILDAVRKETDQCTFILYARLDSLTYNIAYEYHLESFSRDDKLEYFVSFLKEKMDARRNPVIVEPPNEEPEKKNDTYYVKLAIKAVLGMHI